jgi:hypothetical protein
MQKLQLFDGDYIKLRGNADQKEVICVVKRDRMCADGCIKLNPRACATLRLSVGDNVTPQFCNVSFGKRVMYRFVGNVPSASWMGMNEPGSFQKAFLRVDEEVLVCAGETFRIRSDDSTFTIQIISTDPDGICILTSETEMVCDESTCAQHETSAITSPEQHLVLSIGDLVRLHRPDGQPSTLLRKRATSSRSVFVYENCAMLSFTWLIWLQGSF